jgi:ligand-binding sensor domain-containing protein/signal transduction histidine kinase
MSFEIENDRPVGVATPGRSRLFHAVLHGCLLALALPALADSGWIARAWKSDDGLPNNNVTSIAQTPDGYLWVANASQLARFDGVRFETFSSGKIVPGHGSRISMVLTSRKGGLWLAMDHGPVAHLSRGTQEVFTNNLPDLVAQGLVEDGEGAVWIVYHGGVVCRIQNGVTTQFTNNQSGLPSNSNISLVSDGKGRLWFSSRGQFGMSRDGNFVTLQQMRESRLGGARHGGVWMCQGSRLIRCDENGQQTDLGTFESGEANVTVMQEDHNGALWIGTYDRGLFCYDNGKFESVPTSHRQILSLVEDREGNIWVGTGGGGLNRVQRRAVVLEGKDSGLPFEAVQSICEDTNGRLWAVTQSGLLACREDGRWKAATDVWRDTRVTCVAADRAGNVWIGTRGAGLLCWSDNHLTTWQYSDGLVSRNIHALLTTAAGDVWIGGSEPDSLQRLREGHFQSITVPTNGGMIRTLAEDASGDIWVAPARRGLLRVKGDTVTDETLDLSGATSAIRYLYGAPDGSLWIGFAAAGVGRLRAGRFHRYTLEQGLYDDSISQIVADNKGWLWFGADHGIFKVREREFEDLAVGRVARLRPLHYGQSSGLDSLQANFGYGPDALRSHDGRVWLPMRSGVAIADPGDLHEDGTPPPVLLKAITIDDHVLGSYGGAIPVREGIDLQQPPATVELPPGHRRLEFEFTALSFAAPENVQFRYRLEGFDDHWIEAKGTRSASYSRLPEGDYRFQVKACNNDGVWNEAGASFAFSVQPFLWQTWWFRLAAVGSFTIVVFALARYVSVRRVKARIIAEQAALEKSRMAGTAEVATSVLHNVGNVLNSVNVSASIVSDKLHQSKVSSLSKVTALLNEHAGDRGFLFDDARGKQVLPYLSSLVNHLEVEQKDVIGEVKSLVENVGHIKQIIVRQQSYARTAGTLELFNPTEVAEDALRINASTIGHGQIQITREFNTVPSVTSDKHKILQILINLISNSKHALRTDNGSGEKKILVRVEKNGEDRVKIMVRDNGMGISPENKARIFQYGFTTRKDGHGFGLHSSVMAARELGGSLTFESEGIGHGAAFTLEFPCHPPATGH